MTFTVTEQELSELRQAVDAQLRRLHDSYPAAAHQMSTPYEKTENHGPHEDPGCSSGTTPQLARVSNTVYNIVMEEPIKGWSDQTTLGKVSIVFRLVGLLLLVGTIIGLIVKTIWLFFP